MIELIAGMAIGSILLGIGLFGANQAMRILDMETVKFNASRMMNAGQTFFESHCNESSPPTATISRLVNEEHLDSTEYRHNPFGSPMVVVVQWGDPTKIEVRTTMDSGPSMEGYLHSLQATRYSGRTLYWEQAPRLHGRVSAEENLEFLQLHGSTYCQ